MHYPLEEYARHVWRGCMEGRIAVDEGRHLRASTIADKLESIANHTDVQSLRKIAAGGAISIAKMLNERMS